MKKFITEFKEFALKGNAMDLAVGMMIGAAFGKIVSSLVGDILMPLIAAIFRIQDFSALRTLLVDNGAEELNVYLNYGTFIQTIIDFFVIALCIFLIVRAINNLRKPKEEEAPAKSDEVVALEQIIELLKKK